jgi:hypothetical protein
LNQGGIVVNGSNLRLSRRVRFHLARLLAVALSLCLALWLSWTSTAWTQSAAVVLPVTEQTYPQLVDQARPLVWETLQSQFQQFPDASQVTVDVMGERNAAKVPLFRVVVPKSAWQSGMTVAHLDSYTQFYTAAGSLLNPATPTPSPSSPQSQSSSRGLRLLSSQPEAAAERVAVSEPILLEFNQPLAPSLSQLQMALHPPMELAFAVEGQQLSLLPQQPLQYSTTYQFQLQQLGDQVLAQPVDLSFRTEPQYTFEQDIQPLLKASCVGCHRWAGRQRQHPLDTYAAVLSYVHPGNEDSELLNPRWLRRHAPIQREAQPSALTASEDADQSGRGMPVGSRTAGVTNGFALLSPEPFLLSNQQSTLTAPQPFVSADSLPGGSGDQPAVAPPPAAPDVPQSAAARNDLGGPAAETAPTSTLQLLTASASQENEENSTLEPEGPFIFQGSPELAYIRQNGTPLSRLGQFTPAEIEIIRTWIIQDGAIEK